MYRGWIKLYRCLLDDPLWQCSTAEQKVILVTLLLMGNHAEKKWQWQGQPYTCRPGQMITSLKSIAHKAGPGTSRKRVHLALQKFENCGFLVKQATRNNTLITLCNWDAYQNNPYADETPDDISGANTGNTDGAQRSLNKKIRSKNEKKLYINDASFYYHQKVSQQHDADFEKAKAEFLRRAALKEKEDMERQST